MSSRSSPSLQSEFLIWFGCCSPRSTISPGDLLLEEATGCHVSSGSIRCTFFLNRITLTLLWRCKWQFESSLTSWSWGKCTRVSPKVGAGSLLGQVDETLLQETASNNSGYMWLLLFLRTKHQQISTIFVQTEVAAPMWNVHRNGPDMDGAQMCLGCPAVSKELQDAHSSAACEGFVPGFCFSWGNTIIHWHFFRLPTAVINATRFRISRGTVHQSSRGA